MKLSRWRRESRRVIHDVISANPTVADPTAMLKLIDAAYPFGERSRHPYKCWLVERALFMQSMPRASSSDLEALEVARDAEMEGRLDSAAAILGRVAITARFPKVPCPVCGAHAFRQCRDVETKAKMLVPHVTRMRPASGPLFGGV